MHDGLQLEEVSDKQQAEFPQPYAKGNDPDNKYTIINHTLYSLVLPGGHATEYPRPLLHAECWDKVMDCTRPEVRHLATQQTLRRICESYMWTDMKRSATERSLCEYCLLHTRGQDHVPIVKIPVPFCPGQIIRIDFTGPMRELSKCNTYIVTIFYHCTRWAEAIPLPNKPGKTVWDAFVMRIYPDIRSWKFSTLTVGVISHLMKPYQPEGKVTAER